MRSNALSDSCLFILQCKCMADHTLTAGILSGVGREMKSPTGRVISNCLQTDASSNPGNSGGPLLRSNGQLIGMNTSIYSPSGASAGVGFAIPSDTIKQIAASLIANGRVIRPVMGISYLESAQARSLGITDGILVLGVTPGSGAAKAGIVGTTRAGGFGSLELGDRIVAIDGHAIAAEADLFSALEEHKVGDIVHVRVTNERDGTRTLDIKLGQLES
jgi:S1-C subfamily serine protease